MNKLIKYKQQLIDTTVNVIKFDTVRTQPTANAPFGEGNRRCLEYVLEVGKQMGFETYNCDNYAGHIEYGTGDEIVGVLGHLDVVPVGDGWTHDPFGGEIFNNRIYGRGTMDDKGPMIAALLALKALKDEEFVPSKKIRLIFGCDEESGMGCMRYYRTKEKLPNVAFSPDGDFPLINIEKGIYPHIISLPLETTNILEVVCGTRMNVVPDKCQVTIANKNVDVAILDKHKISYIVSGDKIILNTTGINAHASTPEEGLNASYAMFKALSQLYPTDVSLNYIATHLCLDNNGVAWGVPLADEISGKLTHNIGVVTLKDNVITLSVDIRFPATFKSTQVAELIKKSLPANATISGRANEPMLVSADNPLVTTLLDCYQHVTGVEGKAKAIGGGTYSRMLPCCVAFGPQFPNEPVTIHQQDEYVDIDRLVDMANIYYLAIKNLSK